MEAGETIKFRWSPHLWVVVSDPSRIPTRFFGDFSSRKPGVPFDSACMANVGVTYLVPSFVYYRFARSRLQRGSGGRRSPPAKRITSAWPPVENQSTRPHSQGELASKFIARKPSAARSRIRTDLRADF